MSRFLGPIALVFLHGLRRDHGNHETVRRAIASGRVFSTNTHEICRHLQNLLRQVYCQIYRKDPEAVEFTLVPMPRLEIETIQDFKVLHEIGVLTPDMSVKISRILLGEDPHSRAKHPNNKPAPEGKSSLAVSSQLEAGQRTEGVKIAPGKTVQKPPAAAGKAGKPEKPPPV